MLRTELQIRKDSVHVAQHSVRCAALCAVLFALCLPAHAQSIKKLPRIGYLTVGSPETTPARYEAFRQGLREVGYTEGKDIIIEDRYAEEKLDRLPHFAAELVALKVDLIVSGGPTPTSAAKQRPKRSRSL